MDQWLEALADFVADPSSVPNTHMVALKHLYSSSWVSDAPSGFLGHLHLCVHTHRYPHRHIIKNKINIIKDFSIAVGRCLFTALKK